MTMQQVYERLAQRFEREQEPRQRDNLLVLAADAALTAGAPQEAERLRQRLLELNPHHLLRPFASFADALQSQDIKDLLADLRRQYPPNYAKRLLGEAGDNGTAAPVADGRRPGSAPVAPRREPPPQSPYERYELPVPAGRGFESWSPMAAQAIFWIALLAACAAALYVLGVPFFR
jgi:hypothetical protein